MLSLYLRVEQDRGFYGRLPASLPLVGRIQGLPPTLTAKVLASGLLGSLTWYLENGRIFAAEEVAAWTWTMQGMAPWRPWSA